MAALVAYPLRVFLDLSTGHLTPQTRDWMDGRAISARSDPFNGLCLASTSFGWFIYAGEQTEESEFPADLLTCLRKARELGAEYVLFDADASDGLDLPTYDDNHEGGPT